MGEESIEKGDLGDRIGGHSSKKREMNLVAHFALLLSTSPLALPGSPTFTPLSAGGRGGVEER